MNDTFLPADVCAKLVEAGMAVEDGHRDWWVQFGARWERQSKPKYSLPERALLDSKYTPAVTPLQALDWLVASGRIGDYRLGTRSCMAWFKLEDVAEPPDFGTFKGWDGGITTPTDLVRAVLEAA